MKAEELLIRSYIQAHFHSNKKNLSQILISIENSAESCDETNLKQTISNIASQAKNKLPISNRTTEGLKEYEEKFGHPSGGVSIKGFTQKEQLNRALHQEEQLNRALHEAKEYLKTQLTQQLTQAINDTDTYNFSDYINQPQSINHYHYTVLHVAILNNEKDLFDSLLGNKNHHKLNIDQAAYGNKTVNDNQITPLEQSIFIKDEYYALQLIEHGADYTHQNRYKETCEDRARWISQHRETPTQIHQKILDKQRTNSSGSTPDPQAVHSSPTSSSSIKLKGTNWQSEHNFFPKAEDEKDSFDKSNIELPVIRKTFNL